MDYPKWNEKQYLDLFKKHMVAVHCPTEEICLKFFKYIQSFGVNKWDSGESLFNTRFTIHGCKTCYSCWKDGGVLYSDLQYYKTSGDYFIVEFE